MAIKLAMIWHGKMNFKNVVQGTAEVYAMGLKIMSI